MLLRVSLIVCRVPNATSVESVARISAAEISAMAATRAGSRVRPIVTSGAAATPIGCGSIRVDGGGEHDSASKTAEAKLQDVILGMLFLFQ